MAIRDYNPKDRAAWVRKESNKWVVSPDTTPLCVRLLTEAGLSCSSPQLGMYELFHEGAGPFVYRVCGNFDTLEMFLRGYIIGKNPVHKVGI